MIKNLLNTIPYIFGFVYFAYCLINIDAWVKSHNEEYLLFVIFVWIVAVFLAVIVILLRLIKKRKLKLHLPLFLFVIGLIVCVIASNTPCCIGC